MQKKNFVEDLNLPSHYNNTSLTLIARDPYWVFAHWKIAPYDLEKLKGNIGEKLFKKSSFIIRMHDVTSVDFNGKNANSSFDIDIALHANKKYINLPCDNVNYCAELGINAPGGKFLPIATSNFATTPRLSPSPRSDVIWMDPGGKKRRPFVALKKEEKNKQLFLKKEKYHGKKIEDLPRKAKRMFLTEDDIRAYYSRIMPLYKKGLKETAKISAKKDGNNRKNNHPVNGAILNNIFLNEGFNNNFLGSSAIGSSEQKIGGASERQGKGRKFFFEIGTELIVYGRTEPSAEVRLNDKKIELRSDGTFNLRFALPDGRIPLDFIAMSNDKVDKRTITTSAERARTKSR
ncbi:MAG: DUF4912 domain-containing protein [bacterium]